MLRRISVFLIVCITMLSFLYMAYAQMAEKKSKKITLPNGEVVWDLNGEWDVLIENYGFWSQYGTYRDVFKITQKGSSFVAIRKAGNPPSIPPGSEGARGELSKNGFKKVQVISAVGPFKVKGQISDDGNKIVLDDGDKIRQSYTRK